MNLQVSASPEQMVGVFSENGLMTAVVFFAYSLVPVAIGFAILCYRLYDMKRACPARSPTRHLTASTAMLAGAYVGGVALLTKVPPFSGEFCTAVSVLVAWRCSRHCGAVCSGW